MSLPDLALQRVVLGQARYLDPELSVLHARLARVHAEMVRVWGVDPAVFLELVNHRLVRLVRSPVLPASK